MGRMDLPAGAKLADTQAKIEAREERITGLEAELNLIRTRRRHILSLI